MKGKQSEVRHQATERHSPARAARSHSVPKSLESEPLRLQQAIADPTMASPVSILALQRLAGNRAVSHLLQAKLMVGPAGDRYEQEADRVAERVMGMPNRSPTGRSQLSPARRQEEDTGGIQARPLAASITRLVQRQEEEEELQTKPLLQRQTEEEEELQTKPLLQRQAEEEEELQTKPLLQRQAEEEEELQTKPLLQRQAEEEEELQTKPLVQRQAEEEEELQTKPLVQRRGGGGFEAGSRLESRLATDKGGGNPLPDEVRTFMEPRFGADFSGVRVHTGNEAVQMNQELSAQAFTHGQDIYLGTGRYDPGSSTGKRLLAHELTHVVQQGAAGPQNVIQRAGTKPRSFSKDGKYMIKLSSEREEFVYKNKEELGMAGILPEFFPITNTHIEDEAIDSVSALVGGQETNIELKEPIKQPKEGQKVLCIETLGYEQKRPMEPKSQKFVMDVKIGTHTKSLKQFALEGASVMTRFGKMIEHGLKDGMPRWVKKQDNRFKKFFSKLFRGSRQRGYDICDGEVEFEEEHASNSVKFHEALTKIVADVGKINDTMKSGNIAFVGASVFAVFNLTNPQASVAKMIDPDHPILMDQIAQKIQKSAPPGVMTKGGYGKVLNKYNKLRRKMAKSWAQYQAKWKKGFKDGLANLLAWFKRMLKSMKVPKTTSKGPRKHWRGAFTYGQVKK
jgi:hypothetical protein